MNPDIIVIICGCVILALGLFFAVFGVIRILKRHKKDGVTYLKHVENANISADQFEDMAVDGDFVVMEPYVAYSIGANGHLAEGTYDLESPATLFVDDVQTECNGTICLKEGQSVYAVKRTLIKWHENDD